MLVVEKPSIFLFSPPAGAFLLCQQMTVQHYRGKWGSNVLDAVENDHTWQQKWSRGKGGVSTHSRIPRSTATTYGNQYAVLHPYLLQGYPLSSLLLTVPLTKQGLRVHVTAGAVAMCVQDDGNDTCVRMCKTGALCERRSNGCTGERAIRKDCFLGKSGRKERRGCCSKTCRPLSYP